MESSLTESLIPNTGMCAHSQIQPDTEFLDLSMNAPSSIYDKLQSIAAVTHDLIIQGNIQKAKRFLALIDTWYSIGTNEIRNSIANEFILPFTTSLEMQYHLLAGLLPANLRKEYYQQINTTGI